MNEETIGYYAPDKASIVEKITRKIFPWHHVDIPEMDGTKDGIRIDSTITLSFVDRVKVLFTGRIYHRAWIATENTIGRHKAESKAWPMRPTFLERE